MIIHKKYIPLHPQNRNELEGPVKGPFLLTYDYNYTNKNLV
jgi:hypothetical protein